MFCWCIQIRWTPPNHVTINWSGEAFIRPSSSTGCSNTNQASTRCKKNWSSPNTPTPCTTAGWLRTCWEELQKVRWHTRKQKLFLPWFARCGYPRSRTWYCWNICNARKRTRADFYLPSHPLWRYCSFKCHFCHINAASNNRKDHFLQWKHKQECYYLSCDRPTRLRPSTLNNWSPAAKRPSWRTQTAQTESDASRVSAKTQRSLWEPTTSAAPPLTTDLM